MSKSVIALRSACKTLFSLGALLSLLAAIPTSVPAQDDEQQPVNPIAVPSLGTELWRGVRGTADLPGISQVAGMESGVLINPAGDSWQKLRNGPVRQYSGYAIAAVFCVLVIFFLMRGQVKIDGGRSGVLVERWKLWERVLHWYIATLFIILTLSGLSLLFGRTLLIPLIGADSFGYWALTSKVVHNYIGPFFSAGVAVMVITQFAHNLPNFTDLKWFLQGGGLIGGKHPSAGRVNGGEKVFVFWVMATVGIAVCASGILLDFPDLVETREAMQQANIIHAVSAIVWISFVIGHIYLGSVGVEGVFEGMWRGDVDSNWARQHHNLWYDEVKNAKASTEQAPDGKLNEQPAP